jgi:hypothetical protein
VAKLANSASGAIEVSDTSLTISRDQPRVDVQTTVKVSGAHTGRKGGGGAQKKGDQEGSHPTDALA